MSTNYLRGVGVALVTPFNEDESVDYASLETLINHVIDGGVQYLVTLGTTGETPTLSKEEKKVISQFTLKIAGGRLPVVIGIGGANTKEVIEQIQYLEANKFAAILSVSPFYNKPSQEGIYQHFKAVATSTKQSIILYNVPGRTGRSMEVATTIKLATEFNNIIAIKEASADILQSMNLVQNAPGGFTILSGDDDLVLPQIACGVQGVISVVANYYAKDFSDMVKLCHANDYEKARQIHYQLLQAIKMMFEENNPAGIKAFLSAAGLLQHEAFRLPAVPVSNNLKERIKTHLTQNA